jgi:hypothetical protein
VRQLPASTVTPPRPPPYPGLFLLARARAPAARGRRHQRKGRISVEFLVPVLVRLRKTSTKGMLRNQTCKRLLNNRFV